MTRAAQGKRGHVEVCARGTVAEGEHIGERDPGLLARRLQIRNEQAIRKVIVPGGHGRVRGKYGARRHGLDRRVEGPASLDQSECALDDRERSVTLVDMPDRRVDSQRAQCTHTPYAQHDFLFQARQRVAAVESMRDIAIVFAVARKIRVEQIKRDTAHRGLPDLGVCDASAERYVDDQLGAVAGTRHLDRKVAEFGVAVFGTLMAIAIDGLDEVSLAIEQADADEGQVAIAGRLAVIARENAKTTRIDRQAFMDAEFGAEIRDQ